MSDGQKLKDCVTEYRKANKALDDNLKKAEATHQQARREKTEQSNHSY